MSGPRGKRNSGFTLIEIIIVLGIIGLLVGLGLPQYKSARIKSREAVLRVNLTEMRKQIDLYYLDKGHYPLTLQALVQEGYFRSIPVDPMTGSSSTWLEIRETPAPDDFVMFETLGVVDVKSSSEDKSPLDGSFYNTW
jgi:general secretion pathway protein G